ncbi:MAG: transcription/translation regulatory transformer protein RfaH [Gammaproteobacteria bacterium]|nr:transcription/translation regulatory transformer protein RfaH [Gammaproteobacteria bacterium]
MKSLNDSLWYLLQCKPREELRAKKNLENQGYNTFLPQIATSKKTQLGYTKTSTPLFPGYLFIKLNHTTDNWAPVRSTRGVNKLVRFGQNTAIVPKKVIKAIKQQIKYQDPHKAYPFSKGDNVTITSGPFKELQAIFDCRNGQQRAWVLLELMGKWQRITIDDIELNKVA